MDLNIIYDDCGEKDITISVKVEKAFAFGFETVAINTIVPSTNLDVKKVNIPEPHDVTLSEESSGKKRILKRLTAVIKDGIHGHNLMQSPVAKKYDIIAVQPVGEKMLQHACSAMEVDVISLDLTENLQFHLKRTYLNQARQRGITFEIQYSPCLRDQSARRWVISNSQMLVSVLRGKNIIVSSGAKKILELRGVHDVVNLCHLFGFKENMAKAAVVTNGKLVLSHSGTRMKTGCGFVSVEEVFRLTNQTRWLVSACRIPPKKGDAEDTSEKSIEMRPFYKQPEQDSSKTKQPPRKKRKKK